MNPCNQVQSTYGDSLQLPLRKGKWVAEEEDYTNKIIESFNHGTLLIPENEKGMTPTLRSYLSAKLHCDPMRITKKYTGAQCLGKRVYHQADMNSVSTEEIVEVQRTLHELEQRFKQRLVYSMKEKKRSNDGMSQESTNPSAIGQIAGYGRMPHTILYQKKAQIGNNYLYEGYNPYDPTTAAVLPAEWFRNNDPPAPVFHLGLNTSSNSTQNSPPQARVYGFSPPPSSQIDYPILETHPTTSTSSDFDVKRRCTEYFLPRSQHSGSYLNLRGCSGAFEDMRNLSPCQTSSDEKSIDKSSGHTSNEEISLDRDSLSRWSSKSLSTQSKSDGISGDESDFSRQSISDSTARPASREDNEAASTLLEFVKELKCQSVTNISCLPVEHSGSTLEEGASSKDKYEYLGAEQSKHHIPWVKVE